jgi:hypothetical protein
MYYIKTNTNASFLKAHIVLKWAKTTTDLRHKIRQNYTTLDRHNLFEAIKRIFRQLRIFLE